MSRTYQDLLAEARTQVPEIEVAELAERVGEGDAPLVIDVRERSEWDEGHIPGSVHVPRGHLESRIGGVARPDQEIVIACASGARSLLAGQTLNDMGYMNVQSLAGGPVQTARLRLDESDGRRSGRSLLVGRDIRSRPGCGWRIVAVGA